jgi:TRAP-type mannitol/chloroaromatic compound transport system permease large subunit
LIGHADKEPSVAVATAATVGVVATPEIERRGYNARLCLGIIAAGTLGIFSPPSMNPITAREQLGTPALSSRLHPGRDSGRAIFSLTALVSCIVRPKWGGERLSFELGGPAPAHCPIRCRPF